MTLHRPLFSSEDLGWATQRIPAWKRLCKRIFDLSFSATLLVLALPFLFLMACGIKRSSPGPVFFRQARVGRLGKPFFIMKLRTMVEDAESRGGIETWEKDPRITRFGRFLRAWALDELPQLWNVVKGEMSLVGPRPTIAAQVDQYTDRQKRRLLVNPGLTGLAQVSGRNTITWPERIELDLAYIEHYTLRKDIDILFQTVKLLVSRKGVYGNPRI